VEESELRYADGPSTEAALRVAAPAAIIWPFVCDIQTSARFSSEFQGGELLDGATATALGVQFRGHNAHPARGEWTTVSTVCEFQPERVFGWAVGDPAFPAAQWRFTLVPDDDGTIITQWMQMGPGESGISEVIRQLPDKESRILRRRLAEHRANMVATLEGIKGLAEGR
jgi:ligand-binding SRPBCC domain-containing protein